ncbi:transglycosylase SLT domain-containing protein [Novosphingobium sp. KCTC 2891]|uniref:transglycosylase SLT domain-containing protein n=1 Tax=Novosphingobium sp. KCTC 2891 TaxID=2989730 RepID=UPI002222EE48|nr:transglycosylase SLT domain-containing protein [Novosphingobium sp. KCTC 2891]MCW1382984.1 transglycosylase SLT domain-containing protein [Novosphingobium sp. KCTC 2891]
MSSVQSVPGAGRPAEIHAAIARAAEATGVDFDYLLAQARLESGLDPQAQARTSSATGLYQFTDATWMRTLGRHAAEHGIGWASDAIQTGAARDPQVRSQLMALRRDPQVSALMAGELANDNRGYLVGSLGREPDSAELYMAHFLGAEGSARFLSALDFDPSQSAAAILPKAAAANRSIFFGPGGARSVGEVMDLMRGKLAAAMPDAANGLPGGGTFMPAYGMAPSMDYLPVPLARAGAEEPSWGGPVAREFRAAAAEPLPGVTGASGSMSDMLRDTFGVTEGGTAPEHVRAAYGRLRAYGL